MLELNKIYCMDCLEGMKQLDDNSVDSIVTDPPYELGFMGKAWDSTGIAYNVELWKEALRVLKPGGHLLAFGGTRTYHRMACAIEDAGFEIRDSIQNFFTTNNIAQEFLKSLTQEQAELFWRLLDAYGLAGQMAWIYGGGFPKSMDISKAIDKKFGAKRNRIEFAQSNTWREKEGRSDRQATVPDNNPITFEAQQWDGWGTSLKPANEPICVARKPLSENTIAENVLKWGTGGINIDDCRVETDELKNKVWNNGTQRVSTGGSPAGSKDFHYSNGCVTGNSIGRFPANVIFDEEAGKMLDGQSGINTNTRHMSYKRSGGEFIDGIPSQPEKDWFTQETGGASRFFYCAKASKKERGEGNNHPTVKPIKLIEYLVTLVTPKGGICLDPFEGSGTHALACMNLGVNYIGFELSPEYCDIAEKRIAERTAQLRLF